MAVDALDNLKKKAIQDYKKFVRRVLKGHRDDYSILMSEINFIELYNQIDNRNLIREYFLNYGV